MGVQNGHFPDQFGKEPGCIPSAGVEVGAPQLGPARSTWRGSKGPAVSGKASSFMGKKCSISIVLPAKRDRLAGKDIRTQGDRPANSVRGSCGGMTQSVQVCTRMHDCIFLCSWIFLLACTCDCVHVCVHIACKCLHVLDTCVCTFMCIHALCMCLCMFVWHVYTVYICAYELESLSIGKFTLKAACL